METLAPGKACPPLVGRPAVGPTFGQERFFSTYMIRPDKQHNQLTINMQSRKPQIRTTGNQDITINTQPSGTKQYKNTRTEPHTPAQKRQNTETTRQTPTPAIKTHRQEPLPPLFPHVLSLASSEHAAKEMSHRIRTTAPLTPAIPQAIGMLLAENPFALTEKLSQ